MLSLAKQYGPVLQARVGPCKCQHTPHHDLCTDFKHNGHHVFHDFANACAAAAAMRSLVCRYGGEHAAPELQKEAVYGLTEIYRDHIKPARLVANPGCYPTSVQLPLYPLLKDKLIKPEDIIIDSKSGMLASPAKTPCGRHT